MKLRKILLRKRMRIIKNLFGNPTISMIPRFFGRADLWMSLSRANFDKEADFWGPFGRGSFKITPNCRNTTCLIQNVRWIRIKCVEKWNVRNHLKCVLAKFRTDPSHARGVTKNCNLAFFFLICSIASYLCCYMIFFEVWWCWKIEALPLLVHLVSRHFSRSLQ